MKKRLFSLLSLLAAALCFVGCMISCPTPFADINKLGTIVKPGQSITIQNTNGTVTVEYVAPTRRRIIFNGEAREIRLYKSSYLNGIYSGEDRVKLRPDPIGKIKDVVYGEYTAVLKSKEDVDDLIKAYTKDYGYEHRASEHMCVYFEKRKYFNFGIKWWNPEYLVIMIHKYKIDAKNGRSFIAGGHPQQTSSVPVGVSSPPKKGVTIN